MISVTFISREETVLFNFTCQDYIWVGINDIAVEGTFVQIDGTPLPSTLPWGGAGPSNSNGNENCVVTSKFGFELVLFLFFK